MNYEAVFSIVITTAALVLIVGGWCYALGQDSVPKSLTSEWHKGYNEGIKAASIGIARDSKGRFRKAK